MSRRTNISCDFRFESAHRLPNVPTDHKCYRLHGHSFRVTVTVEGPMDPKLGWVVDFAELRAAWRPLNDLLDHRLLNDVAGLENPTSENLAHFILDRYQVEGVTVVSVTVHETCTSNVTVHAA